ncbi:calcium-binding protein, partial [Psychromarinibacter halotolerans]|nr:hypothetical protein [Psychromarinibacter halotolerans]
QDGANLIAINLITGDRDQIAMDVETLRFTDVDVDVATTSFGTLQTALPGGGTVTGSAQDDELLGDAGDDTLVGVGGNDRLDGQGGNDSIEAGDGADLGLGGDGDDTILGGLGDDTLQGGEG